jgi:hypothetical protein
LDGNTALIGSYLDASNYEVVYVFTRTNGFWDQEATLRGAAPLSPDLSNAPQFGSSLALGGHIAVIGSPSEDESGRDSQGAAYVLERSGTVWSQQARLTAANPRASEYFGWAVAIDGESALIGATAAQFSWDNTQGAAYVFSRTAGTWSQQSKLTASNPSPIDSFGWSVAIDGGTALIGARYDDGPGGQYQGSAYIFSFADCDTNGVPDSCQSDCNTDGIPDACESEADADADGVADDCDNCLADSNADQADLDDDGLGDSCDNCPADVNPDQADDDTDDYGNACDLCAGAPDGDIATFTSCMTGPGAGTLPPACDCADLDGDGDADLADFGLFAEQFARLNP